MDISVFKDENQLKSVFLSQYKKQIDNFFGDQKQALKFLSNVAYAFQHNPKLQRCTAPSVIHSFMVMAQLNLMPSDVSGEAYVIPYENNKKVGDKWEKVLEAQFQLGYPGIVTLLYRAGNREVIAELVREKDIFSISRGKVTHEVDPRKNKEERGDWIGAYGIIVTASGGTIEQYMTKKDILDHAKKFSKSFGTKFTPWDMENDPEGWMPRKTILKQTAKLAPKNESLNLAIAEDNKDSIISDRIEAAKNDSKELTMGALIKHDENKNKEGTEQAETAKGNEAEPEEEPGTIY